MIRLSNALALSLVLLVAGCGRQGAESSGPLPFAWPPVSGAAYPDLVLRDVDGQTVQLSAFRGKTILIEPIGMT